MHAAPGQQVYVTVDTGGHMASPAQVYFDQVSSFVPPRVYQVRG